MISTSDFKHLGSIRTDLKKLKDWCYSQLPTMTYSVSNYTVGRRKEKWFEKGWKLSQPVEVFDAFHDERIYQLGQGLFPDNDACLFLYYPQGAYIKPHQDHTASENWVVQINIGCPVTLTVGGNRYPLADGEIVGFNSKVLHSVCAAPEDRFVISWRKIKPIYLNRQLSIL
ncbi:MAG: alpha-ketoglutarate-dependent dioxygenase AlkB [Hydrococcus sp. RM1_1_31]|nr:alpha-ketoglutarate-dependent dioxygenase AlkB [Hydrococcus sp. RM1_1_31]